MWENIQEIQHAAIKNYCYPQKIEDELSHYNVKNENDKLWTLTSQIFKKFMKNGDIDKFFSNMYSTIVLKAPEFFPSLSCDTVTLLSKKLVDKLVAQHKQLKLRSEEKVASEVQEDTKLTEKEIHGLCYIGGYICQKLHKKLRNCKIYKENSTIFSQCNP